MAAPTESEIAVVEQRLLSRDNNDAVRQTMLGTPAIVRPVMMRHVTHRPIPRDRGEWNVFSPIPLSYRWRVDNPVISPVVRRRAVVSPVSVIDLTGDSDEESEIIAVDWDDDYIENEDNGELFDDDETITLSTVIDDDESSSDSSPEDSSDESSDEEESVRKVAKIDV